MSDGYFGLPGRIDQNSVANVETRSRELTEHDSNTTAFGGRISPFTRLLSTETCKIY